LQAKNVLYLSYDGMTDPLGQSQVIPYLHGLSQRGYSIHLISFEKGSKENSANEIQQALNHAGIIWHPLKYTPKPPVLSTLFDLWVLFNKVKKLQKQHSFELVHCRSYITALVGRWLQKKHEVKFLFDMRGFFADERIDGNIWSLQNPVFKLIYQFFKKQEKIFFSSADQTVCLTHEGKKIIEQQIMARERCSPVSVIPCCADTGLFNPSEISEKKTVYRERINIKKGQEVVAYLGSIGTWYMLPEMLDFFRMLLIKSPNTIFLFITKEDPESIINEAKYRGINASNLRVVKANREEVPIFLSLASVGLFFIKPVFSKKASSPTKQGEFMSMGIPVICNSGVGDSDHVINKYQSGILINDFNELAYHKAVHQINQKKWASAEKIRSGAKDYFSLEKGIASYEKIYSRLIGQEDQKEKTALVTN